MWSRVERASFLAVFGALACLGVILLAAPAVIVVITSFTDSFALRFPPPAYSLRWYRELLVADDLIAAARTSFLVALATTAMSVGLAVPAALHIARSPSKLARALDNLFMSPLILPSLAFGLALVMLITMLGFPLSIWSLIAGHVVVCVPLVLRTTIAALARLDPALLESSESLGASRLYTFRRVILPAISPGVLAGAFVAFISSFDNIPVSLFLADARTVVLPIRMWQLMEGTLDTRVAAVSSVLIVATILLVLLMERLVGLARHLK
jgi:putative spermidine/putrescine transport system permease protein